MRQNCILDANRLLDASTDLWTINPCLDFKEFSDFLDRVHELAFMIKANETVVEASVKNIINLFETIFGFDYPGREKVPALMSIKDVGYYLTPNSHLHLDWLYFVNQAFLKHSQVSSGEEEILVEDWYIFAKIIELLEETSPRIVSEFFFHG